MTEQGFILGSRTFKASTCRDAIKIALWIIQESPGITRWSKLYVVGDSVDSDLFTFGKKFFVCKILSEVGGIKAQLTTSVYKYGKGIEDGSHPNLKIPYCI